MITFVSIIFFVVSLYTFLKGVANISIVLLVNRSYTGDVSFFAAQHSERLMMLGDRCRQAAVNLITAVVVGCSAYFIFGEATEQNQLLMMAGLIVYMGFQNIVSVHVTPDNELARSLVDDYLKGAKSQ